MGTLGRAGKKIGVKNIGADWREGGIFLPPIFLMVKCFGKRSLPQSGAEGAILGVEGGAEAGGGGGPGEFLGFGGDGDSGLVLLGEGAALGLFAFVLRPAHEVVSAGIKGLVGAGLIGGGLGGAVAGGGAGAVSLIEGGEEVFAEVEGGAVGVQAGGGFGFAFIHEIFADEGEVLADVGGDALLQG